MVPLLRYLVADSFLYLSLHLPLIPQPTTTWLPSSSLTDTALDKVTLAPDRQSTGSVSILFSEASDVLTTSSLFPWILWGPSAVSPAQHPLPPFDQSYLRSHLSSFWVHMVLGADHPTPGTSISFPLFLGMGIWPKVNHWDWNLRFLVKLLGKRISFFPTGVAELTEYEYGIGDGHLPIPGGATAWEGSQREEGSGAQRPSLEGTTWGPGPGL